MKNRREKEKNKERNKERVSNSATLDPSVASYDPQGSCGESILVTPTPHDESLRTSTQKRKPPIWQRRRRKIRIDMTRRGSYKEYNEQKTEG